jgi:MFS family permease
VSTVDAQRRVIFADAFGHRDIRRLGFAYSMFKVAEMGVWISITAVAHHYGGVREASIVLIAQLAPAAVAATAVGGVVGRFGTRRTLTIGLLVQGVAIAATGVLLASTAPRWTAYTAAVIASIAVTSTRPSVAAMLPNLVESPRTLAATNVTLGWVDGASTLVGPAIAAVLLGVSGLSAPFIALSVFVLLGTLATIGLHGSEAEFTEPDEEHQSIRAGLAEVSRSRPSRTVLLVLAAQAFVAGTLDLIFVVVAVDLLGRSNADAAWLSSAYGVGALVGAGATIVLVGRRVLWRAVVGAAAVTALGLSLIGLSQGLLAAALIMALCGVGSAALMTSGRTLLQRVTDFRLLTHTFSMPEALEMAMLMLGAIAVPVLIALLTSRWVGIGVALILAAVVVATLRALIASERGANVSIDRIEELHAVDLLGLLPAAALETVAREAEPMSIESGAKLITQGDCGDRFYAVTAGSVSVVRDGVEVAVKGPGCGVGELALLHDVRRTADVIALEPVEVLALDREPFLLVVTGHTPTSKRAEALAVDYLM